MKESLSYEDVQLVPKYSTVSSRKNVNTTVKIYRAVGLGWEFSQPIVPANMRDVTDYKMAIALAEMKSLALVHRFTRPEELISWSKEFSPTEKRYIGFSIGVKDEDRKLASKLYKNGARIFCIDVAHGDSALCKQMTRHMANTYPDILLISGNVCTASGAKMLYENGATIVKVGVGPGSICSTRVRTGNGIPQLSALMEIYEAIGDKCIIIADGGLKESGDIVKALCFSHMVMTGSLVAGCNECPNGTQYEGSSTHRYSNIEGIKSIVKSKGSVKTVINNLLEGVRSGCSYQNAYSLRELRNDPQFVRITSAGWKESTPHIT